jgi:hypothetical protein
VSSIDITMTGAAGAAPTPAVVVCPSVGAVVRAWSPAGVVLDGTHVGTPSQHSAVTVLDAPIALRTTSSTPGDLPPRDPLS